MPQPSLAQSRDFDSHYDAILKAAPQGLVNRSLGVKIPADRPPWMDTGMSVLAGDQITLLTDGMVYISKPANLYTKPRLALWVRIGDGRIFRPGHDTYSFKADRSGPLRIATLQGRWKTPDGEHPAPAVYSGVQGEIRVYVINWGRNAPLQALKALGSSANEDRLISDEVERLSTPRSLPAGFAPLWDVGQSADFFETRLDGTRVIALRSEASAGIVRYPIDALVEPGVRLTWDWRVNRLPSSVAESDLPHHDYASVAVEFDDGQDLSWYWSAALKPESHYACPLPSWPGETHLVVRSGQDQLGTWLSEDREIAPDVTLALNRKPLRVVAVWLISVTVFQRLSSSVDFRKIALSDNSGRERVVFPT